MRRPSLMVLALALVTVAPAWAQNPAKEKPSTEKSKGKGQPEKHEKSDDSSEAARRELKAYYERRAAKPAELPPGIAKNLERGKALPPGIQRSRVPDDLAVRLPKRQGEEWAMVGSWLVSVDKSGIVRQVITP